MFQFWMLVAAACLVGLDQWTKYLAAAHLSAPVSLWPGVFELQYCENRGVAFGMLQGQRWIFIPLTALVVAALAVMLFRSEWRRSRVFCISAALIIAGGIGNLIDRIFRGFVTDFLYFKLIDFPIFNVADCYVTVGAILLFVYLLFLNKDSGDQPLLTVLFGISRKSHKEANHGTDR